MSSKEKRALNQTVKYIGEFIEMQKLLATKEELEHQLGHIEEDLHDMEHKQEDIIAQLEKKGCYLSAEQMPLFDGTEIIVFIVAIDNAIIMYFDGIIAKAKCHPNDEFDAQVGYAICRHRLMQQIMKLKYNI